MKITIWGLLATAAVIGGAVYFYRDIAKPLVKGKGKGTTEPQVLPKDVSGTEAFTGTAVAPASFVTTAEADYGMVNKSVLRQGTY